MSKVRLGDVAVEVRETSKNPEGLPVVGLEHLLPGEITLTQWLEASDNTFTKLFHKGQILFGRRRAYLKKAAVAPFDGVCSGDITVIAAKPDKVLPDMLPFIISNDAFFDYAMEKSAGSLSPRVKWAQLAEYEFDLPELEEQRKSADLLWAMERTRKAYQDLLAQTDELVKSQFVEMFGANKKYPSVHLDEVSLVTSGLTKNPNRPAFPLKMKYLRVANVLYDHIDLDDIQEIGVQDDEVSKASLSAGDVLFVEGNGSPDQIGRVAVWDGQVSPMLHQNHIIKARPNQAKVLPRFIMHYFMTEEGRAQILKNAKTTSGLYTLSLSKIAGFTIPLPSIKEQMEFMTLADQTDKSKYDSRVSLENVWIGGDMCA